jgi:hypothetical protein
VEYKSQFGTKEERTTIKSSQRRIVNLFSNIPNRQRNVNIQSIHFLGRLKKEYHNISADKTIVENINQYIENTLNAGSVISRRPINKTMHALYKNKLITENEYIKAFYACNRAYYSQGAATYNSPIAILNAQNHVNLGQSIFMAKNGINIAYDPTFVACIFSSLGIHPDHIAALTVNDIIKFRESHAFTSFKTDYLNLSEQFRDILHMNNKLIQRVNSFKNSFSSQFSKEILHEQRKEYNKKINYLSKVDMTISNALLALMGYFTSGLTGAAIGFLASTSYGLLQSNSSKTVLYPRIVDAIYGRKYSHILFSDHIKKIFSDE